MKNKSLEYKKYISLVRKFNKLNSKINQLILDKDKLIEEINKESEKLILKTGLQTEK